jgi:hypothetical protein
MIKTTFPPSTPQRLKDLAFRALNMALQAKITRDVC